MKSMKWMFMLLAATAFVACDEDEEVTNGNNQAPFVAQSTGFFVVNEGSSWNTIEGTLTYMDYTQEAANNGVFAAANGRSLGATPNGACLYGSKLYIPVTESNTIEVVSLTDMKSTQIKLDAHLAGARSIVSHKGAVYASLYSGHVIKLDTASLQVADSLALGAGNTYPERMVVAGEKLYVPNSGYMYGTTVSVIDLATFTKTTDLTVPQNPTKLEADASGNVYLLCMGDYATQAATIYQLDVITGNATALAQATMMDIPDGTNTLYACNAPYGGEVSYFKMNLASVNLTQEKLNVSVNAPYAIAVDPVNGNIVVTSMQSSYDYTAPGYANVYDSNCQLLKKVDTGVNPGTICFKTNLNN